MTELSEQNQKIEKLARDVLILSRNTLLVNLRFLDVALSQFEYVSLKNGTFSTNGKQLFYNSRYVLKSYKSEQQSVTRDYLHVVLHCVFRHMYGAYNLKREIWDISCDIAVDAVISDLKIKTIAVKRENEKKIVLQSLQKIIGKMTAERIYHYYLDKGINAQEIEQLRSLFCADDHEIWYWTVSVMNNQQKKNKTVKDSKSDNGNNSLIQGLSGLNYDQNDTFSNGITPIQEQIWRGISERMQVELETFQKEHGNNLGNLLQNLNSVNREKYDFADFLRKFAVLGEVMELNDEEFDYIYYSYGLKLYEKMPLIEPLEYKEVRRIKDFVIAIDTSGSVAGEDVQRFVQKTYNILKSSESFFSRINLHIFQCDTDITEHVKVTNQDEFDTWLRTMTIKGLGGTDFRSVFSKVNELIEQHEFLNLKGLIYFTDGYGVFPEKKPNYETAFVFVSDEVDVPDVPPWAIKLVIRKDEI